MYIFHFLRSKYRSFVNYFISSRFWINIDLQVHTFTQELLINRADESFQKRVKNKLNKECFRIWFFFCKKWWLVNMIQPYQNNLPTHPIFLCKNEHFTEGSVVIVILNSVIHIFLKHIVFHLHVDLSSIK